MEKGVGGETGNDGRREKIPFMIAGKINTSLSKELSMFRYAGNLMEIEGTINV